MGCLFAACFREAASWDDRLERSFFCLFLTEKHLAQNKALFNRVLDIKGPELVGT